MLQAGLQSPKSAYCLDLLASFLTIKDINDLFLALRKASSTPDN